MMGKCRKKNERWKWTCKIEGEGDGDWYFNTLSFSPFLSSVICIVFVFDIFMFGIFPFRYFSFRTFSSHSGRVLKIENPLRSQIIMSNLLPGLWQKICGTSFIPGYQNQKIKSCRDRDQKKLVPHSPSYDTIINNTLYLTKDKIRFPLSTYYKARNEDSTICHKVSNDNYTEL